MIRSKKNCPNRFIILSTFSTSIGSGQQYGLHFVLDSNVVGKPYIQPGNRNPGEFKLALSDIYGPFDIRSDPLSVKAGTSTRVRFGVFSIELTDSVDSDLSPKSG